MSWPRKLCQLLFMLLKLCEVEKSIYICMAMFTITALSLTLNVVTGTWHEQKNCYEILMLKVLFKESYFTTMPIASKC